MLFLCHYYSSIGVLLSFRLLSNSGNALSIHKECIVRVSDFFLNRLCKCFNFGNIVIVTIFSNHVRRLLVCGYLTILIWLTI